METRYLILARYAEFGPNGILNLVGGDQNQFVSESYPYVMPVLLAAAKTVFDRVDGEIEHELRAILVAEDTDEVIAEGAKATIPIFTFPPEVKHIGTGFIIRFSNIVFPRAGRYLVRLIIDDTLTATAPLRVAPLSHFPGAVTLMQETKAESSKDGSHDRAADQ